jgi:hypothetical protein
MLLTHTAIADILSLSAYTPSILETIPVASVRSIPVAAEKA